MKKLSLTLAVLGAMGLGAMGTANAANNGKLVFSGTLTNISCDVAPGTGVGAGPNGDINVDMGNVSFSDIGTSSQSRLATATPIQLLVNCSAGAEQYNTVKMRFVASAGSGQDDNDRSLLKVYGSANGVGIGMVNEQNRLMDLSGTETIDKPLVKDDAGGATAELNFAAVYVLNGTATNPGNADGFMPFVMDYE